MTAPLPRSYHTLSMPLLTLMGGQSVARRPSASVMARGCPQHLPRPRNAYPNAVHKLLVIHVSLHRLRRYGVKFLVVQESGRPLDSQELTFNIECGVDAFLDASG
jgi:hypothetical protein